MHKLNKIMIALSLGICSTAALAANGASIGQDSWSTAPLRSSFDKSELNSKAKSASHYQLDIAAFQAQLYHHDQVQIDIPLPDGTFVTFNLTRSQVMVPALAEKYPNIRTFNGVQVGNSGNTGVFDITPHGFHGVLNIGDKQVYIEPMLRNNNSRYHSYYRHDAQPLSDKAVGLRQAPRKRDEHLRPDTSGNKAKRADNQLKTLRMAVATTGEYGTFHGGTKESVLAALVTMVNRLNDVYRQDMGLQFELVANTDAVIYTDAESDPFENVDDDIDKVQSVVDEAIGAENYDIGHIVTTGGGGLAGLGVVCGGYKAEGLTGSNEPTGDPFFIDYVAHEVGHQLGAEHTFNGSAGACGGNRSGTSAYEPGSASTIMGYAGICDSQNLQMNSDPLFHVHSVDQMTAKLASFEACGTTQTTDNHAPVVEAGPDFIIPAKTPFELKGSGTDPNNDSLLYSWEQMDLGTTTNSEAEDKVDDGKRPLFRVNLPTPSANRTLPNLASLLSGEPSKGEVLPTTTRELNFRLVARDNQGNLAYDGMKVNVVEVEEAFAIHQPSNWYGLEQVVNWHTAGTENPPVLCRKVDIFLSTDGGNTFAYELAKGTDNDGSAEVNISGINSEKGRLKITCANNIFFALSSQDFTIAADSAPVKPVFTGHNPLVVNEDESITISLTDLKFEGNQSINNLTLKPGDNYSLEGLTVTPVADFNGTLTVAAKARAGSLDSDEFSLSITVAPQNDLPQATADSISLTQGDGEQTIDVLSNDSDIDGDSLSLASFDYAGSGSVKIEDNKLLYTSASDYYGEEKITYTVSDGNEGTAQGEVTITVAKKATPPTPTPPVNNSGCSGGGSLWALLLLMAGALPMRLRRTL